MLVSVVTDLDASSQVVVRGGTGLPPQMALNRKTM